MNIGQLAKRTGVTSSRIRFYETAGLLNAVERRPNGYRIYPPEAVMMLELIIIAQKAGFSLDEIRMLLPPCLENWRYDELLAALKRKIADIAALEARLAHSRALLAGLIEGIEAKPEDIDCTANASRVLSHILGKPVAMPPPAPANAALKTNPRRAAVTNPLLRDV